MKKKLLSIFLSTTLIFQMGFNVSVLAGPGDYRDYRKNFFQNLQTEEKKEIESFGQMLFNNLKESDLGKEVIKSLVNLEINTLYMLLCWLKNSNLKNVSEMLLDLKNQEILDVLGWNETLNILELLKKSGISNEKTVLDVLHRLTQRKKAGMTCAPSELLESGLKEENSIDEILKQIHLATRRQQNVIDKSVENFGDIFNKCLEGRKFSQEAILNFCENTNDILKNESQLLEIQGPTIVVGDIHSNIGSLMLSIKLFFKKLAEGENIHIIFLGDYVDRGDYAPGGPNGIENVVLLFILKDIFPDKVFLLRGNHEVENINFRYGFAKECEQKYGTTNGKEIFDKINETFSYLSLAAVVDNETFCVHGGIDGNPNLYNICYIKKPFNFREDDKFSIPMCLLWSDPTKEFSGYKENSDRGVGLHYGIDAVKDFLEKNRLCRIIRAHEPVNGHEDVFGDGTVITLFSAPDYDGKGKNRAEIAEINGNNIKYHEIKY